MPLAEDLPPEFVTITQEQGHGPGPFGAKGAGEATILPIASAIANAIEDAVGVRITELPITPERVLAALDAQAIENTQGAMIMSNSANEKLVPPPCAREHGRHRRCCVGAIPRNAARAGRSTEGWRHPAAVWRVVVPRHRNPARH